MKTWIGIDPGKSGAIAILDEDGSIEFIRLDSTRLDLVTAFDTVLSTTLPQHILLEKVAAMPTDGRSSAFKFGTSYGHCQMLLTVAGYAHSVSSSEVTPPVWKRALGITMPKGSTSTQRKHRAKELCQSLYPGVNVTNRTVEALLLAHYCSKLGT